MNSLNYLKPFDPRDDDLITELLPFSSHFRASQEKTINSLYAVYPQQDSKIDFLTRLRQLKIFRLASQHIVLAILAVFMTFGIVTYAAEQTLPADSIFKPSNVIESIERSLTGSQFIDNSVEPSDEELANIQAENTAFTEGGDYKKYTLAGCGLDIIYPTSIPETNAVVDAGVRIDDSDNPALIENFNSVNITAGLPDPELNGALRYGISALFSCYSSNYDQIPEEYRPAEEDLGRPLSQAEFKTLTAGWDIADVELEDLKIKENPNLPGLNSISFEHQGTFYRFSIANQTNSQFEQSIIESGGIFTQQLWVNFSDQASSFAGVAQTAPVSTPTPQSAKTSIVLGTTGTDIPDVIYRQQNTGQQILFDEPCGGSFNFNSLTAQIKRSSYKELFSPSGALRDGYDVFKFSYRFLTLAADGKNYAEMTCTPNITPALKEYELRELYTDSTSRTSTKSVDRISKDQLPSELIFSQSTELDVYRTTFLTEYTPGKPFTTIYYTVFTENTMIEFDMSDTLSIPKAQRPQQGSITFIHRQEGRYNP